MLIRDFIEKIDDDTHIVVRGGGVHAISGRLGDVRDDIISTFEYCEVERAWVDDDGSLYGTGLVVRVSR